MVNRLNRALRAQILHLLCEGSSMRSVHRVLGVSRATIAKLLIEAGQACHAHHAAHVRGLTPERVECDELWSYVHVHQRRLPTALAPPEGAGDVWTWVALDADTKLVMAWRAGSRQVDTAIPFFWDLRHRLRPGHRFQLNTDRYHAYAVAVRKVFAPETVDYAQLLKECREVRLPSGGTMSSVIAIREKHIQGEPDLGAVSTSYVERQNLNIRMGIKRFTRQTNAFSKKLDRHRYAQAVYFAYHNFCRVHLTLGTTPAVAAGLAAEPYPVEWLVQLVEAWTPPTPRGPDKQPRRRRRK